MQTTEIEPFSTNENVTRKDRLEVIAGIGACANQVEAATSWHLLMQFMLGMALPEAPNTPKFNDLLLVIWKSNLQARDATIKTNPG